MKNKRAIAVAISLVLLSGAGGPAFAAGAGGVLSDPGAMEGKHFHPKGKPPSKYTIEVQKHQREILPFSDKRDFER